MICVIASIKVKEGARDAFLEIFHGNVPRVRGEQGCLEYLPAVDIDSGLPLQIFDESTVTILEKWESLEALGAHLASPHMLDYREKVKNLVEGVSLKVLQQG
ncbi:MAG TPA: antibiotic biosynthesis monooxygenase [Geobacter sp.]|nr:antibiotic biosynthesis monooxygenase [Geobacter sp.]